MRFRICGIICLTVMLSAQVSMAQIAEGLLWGKTIEPIWTEKPVRIDKSKQTYERVADPVDKLGKLIRVPKNVRVDDSGSFSIGTERYIIKAVIPLPPHKLCRNARGHRIACGQQARAYLRKLIQGRSIRCFSEFLARQAWLVDCTLDGKSLAETLVSAGAAFAATPSMTIFEQTSQMLEKGIWADVNCQIGKCEQ